MTSLNILKQLSNTAESDECYTPSDQVQPLLEYLDKDKTYYEATSGKSSNILDGFNKYGYNIVGSDEKDFFDCTVLWVFDSYQQIRTFSFVTGPSGKCCHVPRR